MRGFRSKDLREAVEQAKEKCRRPSMYVVQDGVDFYVVPDGLHWSLPPDTRVLARVGMLRHGSRQIMVVPMDCTVAEHAAAVRARADEIMRKYRSDAGASESGQ